MNRSIKEILHYHAAPQAPLAPAAPQTRYIFNREAFSTDDRFYKSWMALETARLNGRQLVNILHDITYSLPSKNLSERETQRRHFMAQHWSLWEKPMLRKLQGLSPADTSRAIRDIGAIRVLPSETFIQAWFLQAERQAHDATPADIDASLHGLSILRKAPPYSLLAGWYTRLHAHPEALPPSRAADIAWSSAVLHAKTGAPLYEAFFQMAKKALMDGAYPPLDNIARKKIHDAFLWFHGTSPIENIYRTQGASGYEKILYSRLRSMKFDIDTNTRPVPFLNQAIDFSMKRKGARVLFEVDGASHFLHSTQNDGYVSDGKTLFRTALCRKLAPHAIIVRLPFSVIDDWMKRPAVRQHDIMNFIMDEAIAMGPGAYKAKYVDGDLVVDPMLIETSPRLLAAQSLKGHAPQPAIA